MLLFTYLFDHTNVLSFDADPILSRWRLRRGQTLNTLKNQILTNMGMKNRLRRSWETFWMSLAGPGRLSRVACWLAGLPTPGYKGRRHLASRCRRGYIAPSAVLAHDDCRFGDHVFIGENVAIFKANGGGHFALGTQSSIHKGGIIEIGQGGSLEIGANTHIQPRCQLSAYVGNIRIGSNVQIAPACAMYPYNHGIAKDTQIMDQPLTSKGGIVIEDDAWLGYGVIVLDGVKIGKGAVVGAGSLVTADIPDYGVAVGSPAKTIKQRQ